MSKEEQQIITGIIGGSVVLLMLGTFLLLFLFFYQRKHNVYLREKSSMRRNFEDSLAQTQVEVQEQTRRNLAEEIHDNVGQILSLTNATLGSINPQDIGKTEVKIADAQALVTRSIQELRRMSRVLQGQQLVNEGLIEAIRKDVEWLDSKGFYKIQLDIQPNGQDFSRDDVNLFIYRIFQESLNNIIKHAEADNISIFLRFISPFLNLTISDNGKGFDKDPASLVGYGLGLRNMRKRSELLGGTMELDTAVGKGTILIFKIPYASFEPGK